MAPLPHTPARAGGRSEHAGASASTRAGVNVSALSRPPTLEIPIDVERSLRGRGGTRLSLQDGLDLAITEGLHLQGTRHEPSLAHLQGDDRGAAGQLDGGRN